MDCRSAHLIIPAKKLTGSRRSGQTAGWSVIRPFAAYRNLSRGSAHEELVPKRDPAAAVFVDPRYRRSRDPILLGQKGVDAEPLLSKAELSRRQLTQDPGGVSVVSQHRFLDLAAIQMDDPLLGLHVAAEIDLREIGLLFYLAAASATVSEALEYLARYAATTNEEIRLEISHHNDEAVLTFLPCDGA